MQTAEFACSDCIVNFHCVEDILMDSACLDVVYLGLLKCDIWVYILCNRVRLNAH